VARHLEPYVVFVEVDLQLIRILVQQSSEKSYECNVNIHRVYTNYK